MSALATLGILEHLRCDCNSTITPFTRYDRIRLCTLVYYCQLRAAVTFLDDHEFLCIWEAI